MRLVPLAMIWLSVATALPAEAKPAPQGEIVIDESRVVTGTINTIPMRFTVRPGASKIPLLGPEGARKAGLKPGWLHFSGKLRGIKITVYTNVVRYTAPGTARKRRIAWFDRAIVPGFDAVLGPAAFDAPVVTFQLRAASAGEQIYRLPLNDKGYRGLSTAVRIGKEVIPVAFDPDRSATLVSPAAALVLAQTNAAREYGPVFQEEAGFSIKQPFRRLRLGSALSFGPFRLTEMHVGNDGNEVGDENLDDDEIVVTAKRKPKGGKVIAIGGDALSRCSSLTFDKPRKEIRLSCR